MYVLICSPCRPSPHLSAADSNGMMGSMMQDLAFAIPGVDEAMSFAEIMKYVSPLTSTSPPRVEVFPAKAR